jgi:mono/diheme cytochrome c family protein
MEQTVVLVLSERPTVAEIPEHLLARSKARRSALSGEGGTDAAAPVAPASPSSSSTPAVVTPVVQAAKAVAIAVPASAPKEPVVPGLLFAKMARVGLMVGVPLWAFFYAGIFNTPVSLKETPLTIGANIYSSQCSTCHGANGAGSDAGGVGRPLWKGEAEKSFLKTEQQVAFVRHGSCEANAPYGNPKREGGEHVAKTGMPAFPDLTAEQILYVIQYERTILSEKPWPELVAGELEPTAEEIEEAQAKLDVTTAGVCGPGRKGY